AHVLEHRNGVSAVQLEEGRSDARAGGDEDALPSYAADGPRSPTTSPRLVEGSASVGALSWCAPGDGGLVVRLRRQRRSPSADELEAELVVEHHVEVVVAHHVDEELKLGVRELLGERPRQLSCFFSVVRCHRFGVSRNAWKVVGNGVQPVSKTGPW